MNDLDFLIHKNKKNIKLYIAEAYKVCFDVYDIKSISMDYTYNSIEKQNIIDINMSGVYLSLDSYIDKYLYSDKFRLLPTYISFETNVEKVKINLFNTFDFLNNNNIAVVGRDVELENNIKKVNRWALIVKSIGKK